MDPPKPFPILSLPFVPIQEIFKAMDPIEIINFSMITKRTKAVTKNMTFYSKYSIQLYIGEELEVSVVGPEYMTSCCYKFTSNEEKNGEVEGHGWNKIRVWKYSVNPVEEWKQFCVYALEIFKKQTVDKLFMTMTDLVGQNISIIDYVKANLESVDKCSLTGKITINVKEHAAYLLDNIKVNSELSLNIHVDNDDFNKKIPKNLQELRIYNSKWIGYERLLEMDYKSVVLENSLITNEQWNLFFKKWIAMETHLNLEYLGLEYRDIEEFKALVLHDIPHEEVKRSVIRVIKIRHNETLKMGGGLDIRRIDGKTATFYVFWEERFAMSVN